MWSMWAGAKKPRLPQSGPAISRPVQNPPTTSAPTATNTRMDFRIFVVISYHLQQFLCSQSCITSMLMERLQQRCILNSMSARRPMAQVDVFRRYGELLGGPVDDSDVSPYASTILRVFPAIVLD